MEDKLDDYLSLASRSIFRYECLQDYTAEDGDDFVKTFIETGKLNFSPEESQWWRNTKKRNESGIKTCRVRFVTYPMTDYTKAEIAALRGSVEFSGEDVRVILEDELSTIAIDLYDYYLIDKKYLFFMKYGKRGKYLGSFLASSDQVKKYKKYFLMLIKGSVPIADF